MRKINVDTVLRYLGQGISQPALILGDDFEQYILKTQKVVENGENKTYNCMFLNELISYQIAKHLNVPIPEAAIAYMDEKILESDPEIRFVNRFYAGNLFASLELPNIEENFVHNYELMMQMGKPHLLRTWNHFFSNIVNAEDIAKILAFDLLIANFDRYGNTGNLMVSNTNEGRKIFSIDHGHAFFGPEWHTNKIQNLRAPQATEQYIESFVNVILDNNNWPGRGRFANGLGEVFSAIESNIDLTNINNHSFFDIVYEIEQINETIIDGWIREIPDEWFVEKEVQIAYYKQFLMNQKNLIKFLIQRLAERKAFTNFIGGVLAWKTERTAGTV
ncbi:hypothetical protein BC359_02895 [Priestia flexa]|nr:hypothetical protein BC359_02895 [Priestia flexa]